MVMRLGALARITARSSCVLELHAIKYQSRQCIVVHMGNSVSKWMSSSANSARGRQGSGNAAAAEMAAANWNDPRRSNMLADSYQGAPERLSQQPDLQPGWNPAIDHLSKLEYGHKVAIEKETARHLNATQAYLVIHINDDVVFIPKFNNDAGIVRKQEDLADRGQAAN